MVKLVLDETSENFCTTITLLPPIDTHKGKGENYERAFQKWTPAVSNKSGSIFVKINVQVYSCTLSTKKNTYIQEKNISHQAHYNILVLRIRKWRGQWNWRCKTLRDPQASNMWSINFPRKQKLIYLLFYSELLSKIKN